MTPFPLEQPGLGQLLVNTRKKLGLSQMDVSALTGFHPSWISRIERGVTSPESDTLAKLLHGLHMHAFITVPDEVSDMQKSLIASRRQSRSS